MSTPEDNRLIELATAAGLIGGAGWLLYWYLELVMFYLSMN
jgi:hypothetical protein